MARTGRVVTLALAAAALAAATAGCTHSSRTYPYDAQTVWQVCVGECVIWRPRSALTTPMPTIWC